MSSLYKSLLALAGISLGLCSGYAASPQGSGSPISPYNVAGALSISQDLTPGYCYPYQYVNGIVNSISEISTEYGNATFNIIDDDSGNELTVVRSYYLDWANFTSSDQLSVGDKVVVYGDVSKEEDESVVIRGRYLFSINTTPLNTPVGSGFPGDPFNTTGAFLAAMKLEANYGYLNQYVSGTIRTILEVSPESGVAAFSICDDNNPALPLMVFNCLYIDGENFTSESQIAIGDKVTIKGAIGRTTDHIIMVGNTPQIVCVNYAPAAQPSGTGFALQPFNVSGAYKAAAEFEEQTTGRLNTYITGTVCSISEISLEYGNATFKICDEGNKGTPMLVYRSLYLDGADFTSADQLSVGDKVVIKGTLARDRNYNTVEIKEAELVSINEDPLEPIDPPVSKLQNIKRFSVCDAEGVKHTITLAENTTIKFSVAEDGKPIMEFNRRNGTNGTLILGENHNSELIEEELPANIVDLGLSVLWSTTNVGAASITDAGTYFAWGDTAPKSYYGPKNDATFGMEYEKLVSEGYLPDGVHLAPDHDAATITLGSDWRMPTIEEIKELLANSTKGYSLLDGTGGLLAQTRNGASIFFPLTGCYAESFKVPQTAHYWTSDFTNKQGMMTNAKKLVFNPGFLFSNGVDQINATTDYAFYGCAIRPVFDPGCGEGYNLQSGSSDPSTPGNDYEVRYVTAQYIITDSQTGTETGSTSVKVEKGNGVYRVSAFGYDYRSCNRGYNDMIIGTNNYVYYNALGKPVPGRTSYRIMFTVDF